MKIRILNLKQDMAEVVKKHGLRPSIMPHIYASWWGVVLYWRTWNIRFERDY